MSETIVEILLGNILVGRITRVDDTSTFSLDPSYVRRVDRPVLGRVFEDRLSTTEKWVARRNQLPEFFRHYLPEEDTRLRRMIASHHGLKESNELGLLLALGQDLPGAIIARGPEATSFEDTHVEQADSSANSAAAIRLRFSLAGVQLKFSMVERDGKLMLSGELDGDAWIVKLYGDQYEGTAENELSMMRLAQEVGIEIPRIRLVTANDISSLPSQFVSPSLRGVAVARYDRGANGKRIHQEDFAQVFDVPATRDGKYSTVLPKGRRKLNYESIATVLAVVCDRSDVLEFVRRLAFCIVIGNEDAHLKNWSLLYPGGVRAQLSPAYDLVSTVVYSGLHRALALPLCGEDCADKIELAHFEQLADRVSIERAVVIETVCRTLEQLREAWHRLNGELPLIDRHRSILSARIDAPRWRTSVSSHC